MWQLLPRLGSLFHQPAHSRLHLLPLLPPPSGGDNLPILTLGRSLRLCICRKLRLWYQLSLFSCCVCLSVDRFCLWLLYQLSQLWLRNLPVCWQILLRVSLLHREILCVQGLPVITNNIIITTQHWVIFVWCPSHSRGQLLPRQPIFLHNVCIQNRTVYSRSSSVQFSRPFVDVLSH